MTKNTSCKYSVVGCMLVLILSSGCYSSNPANVAIDATSVTTDTSNPTFLSKPLVTHMYTADPSAHVFGNKIYIYPSHDIDAGMPEKDDGSHFDMRDYHILSMDSINGPVKDNGLALNIKDIPWAKKQLWAPDAAYKNGVYYLYFPAKDKNEQFKIGVATSASPTGPFRPQAQPMRGSYSIDPAVFTDADENAYMYFGGIWGGQLQKWRNGKFDSSYGQEPKDNELALGPRVAKMSKDMLSFEGPVKEIKILDREGRPLMAGDHNRRFFEASWMHKYKGKYYFSYSTGDTHFIAYATGDSPYGPFTYQGVVLNPVLGWTSHHSIVEFKGKWYLFYHDTELSHKTHLRNIKLAELKYKPDSRIETITSYHK